MFALDTSGNWDYNKIGTDPNTPYTTNAADRYTLIGDPNAPDESFTYDYDQNLTEDGSFEYVYDAENRIIRIEQAEDDPNNLTLDTAARAKLAVASRRFPRSGNRRVKG